VAKSNPSRIASANLSAASRSLVADDVGGDDANGDSLVVPDVGVDTGVRITSVMTRFDSMSFQIQSIDRSRGDESFASLVVAARVLSLPRASTRRARSLVVPRSRSHDAGDVVVDECRRECGRAPSFPSGAKSARRTAGDARLSPSTRVTSV